MREDFQQYVKQKKRRKRFLTILALTIVMAVSAVFMRECSQNFSEPYNKGYQPMDQAR